MLKPLAPVVLALLLGCQSQSTNVLDSDRILHMAGEEAGQITAPRERLTRQLNIANRETETGQPGNARKTLALARQTIERAEKGALSDQERLAGWISICELSRNAEDKEFAGAALDQALKAVKELTPEPARCEYVPGIEHEVRALRGDAAAAALLRTAADWAMDLSPQSLRREAYLVFAEELFRCNDYEGARKVLRHDSDAAWRSDALTALADRARWESGKTAVYKEAGAMLASIRPESSMRALTAETMPTTSPSAGFGKSLDFKSNFYRP
jgi:hypothetical protein